MLPFDVVLKWYPLTLSQAISPLPTTFLIPFTFKDFPFVLEFSEFLFLDLLFIIHALSLIWVIQAILLLAYWALLHTSFISNEIKHHWYWAPISPALELLLQVELTSHQLTIIIAQFTFATISMWIVLVDYFHHEL